MTESPIKTSQRERNDSRVSERRKEEEEEEDDNAPKPDGMIGSDVDESVTPISEVVRVVVAVCVCPSVCNRVSTMLETSVTQSGK